MKVNAEVAEALALQKQIRDMELELARIKATHPPENVSRSAADSISLRGEPMS
jgi:hypothetical protein